MDASQSLAARKALADLRCELAQHSGELDETARLEFARMGLTERCAIHGVHHLYPAQPFAASAEAMEGFLRSPSLQSHLGELRRNDRRRYYVEHMRVQKQDRVAKLTARIAGSGIDPRLLDEYYSCYRKVAHATPDRAHGHVRSLNEQSPAGGQLQIYQCSYCTGWHVGHQRRGLLEADELKRWEKAIEFLRKGNPLAREFCEEKGIPFPPSA